MALHDIEVLLEKYEKGETNLQEEATLKAYFSQAEVPEHLKVYQNLFLGFKTQESIRHTKAFKFPKTTISYFKWGAVAAMLVLALGLFFTKRTHTCYDTARVGTFCKPEDALYEVSKALTMVSKHLNKGVATINYLETFNEGTAMLKYLEEIDKSTGIIFKTNLKK